MLCNSHVSEHEQEEKRIAVVPAIYALWFMASYSIPRVGQDMQRRVSQMREDPGQTYTQVSPLCYSNSNPNQSRLIGRKVLFRT